MPQSSLTVLAPELVVAIADFSAQADVDSLRGTCKALYKTLTNKPTCVISQKDAHSRMDQAFWEAVSASEISTCIADL